MEWLRQKINHNMSSIFIMRNSNSTTKALIAQILPYKPSSSKMKYLVLPTSFTGAENQSFKDLLEKINNKLEGQKTKLLSQTGRTMLIRAVASTIPTYQIQTFKLPKSMCKTLNTSFKNFLWGFPKEKNHNLSLKSWKSISQPKK